MFFKRAPSLLLRRVSKDLQTQAEKKEAKWSNFLIEKIEKINDEDRYNYLLGSKSNPQKFLKDFFRMALREGDKNKTLKTLLDYSSEGRFQIYTAEYEIDGKKYILSEERLSDIQKIVNKLSKMNPKIKDIQKLVNFDERITGLLWEEAGEKVINRGLDEIFGEDRKAVLNDFTKSKDWKVDSKVSIMIYYTIKEHGKEYANNIEEAEINLEHKKHLDNFHFGDEMIDVDGDKISYLKTLSTDMDKIYLPDIYKSALLKSRSEGFYPIYYSVADRDVLLSSEVLSRPEGFYLVKPKLYSENTISKMAKDIYEEIKRKDTELSFEGRLEEKTSIEKETFDALTKASTEVSMWYSRR